MKEQVNKVQLAGSLNRNPEIRVFGVNKKMARFSIYIPGYTKNTLGEKVQQMQWYNAVAWGKTAEQVEKSLSRGKQVMLNGRLSSRSYLAKDGSKKYATDIVVNDFEVLN